MKNLLLLFFCTMSFTLIQAQEDIHKEKIDAIYTEALTKGKAYEWLDHL